MKKNLTAFFFLLVLLSCNEESKKTEVDVQPAKRDTQLKIAQPIIHYTTPDHSPMDMVYFPTDYPLLKMTGKTSKLPYMRIIYSRPQKEGRKIFEDLIKYNSTWRLGANEATEIEFFSTATIQGKKIRPGRYILYCVPQADKWTFVLNSNIYSWGLQQDRSKDLFQFDVPVEEHTVIEYFTIACEKRSETSVDILFMWDAVRVKLPVSF